MGFLENMKLRGVFDPQAPTGYGMQGMPQQNPIKAAMAAMQPMMLNMRNRDLQDMRVAGQIRNENNRMQQTFNPMQPTPPQNVVLGQSPVMNNEFTRSMSGQTATQNTNLALAKQTQASKTAQDAIENKRADQRLALDREGLQLDKLKNSNIYGTKTKELEDKARIADEKLALATQVNAGKETNAAATQELNRARIEAQNARHELDVAQREAALEETKRVGNARIKDLESQIANRIAPTTVTTDVNADGTQKIVNTVKGGRVSGAGPVGTQPNAANPVADKKAPPPAPAGWKYVRNATNTGWDPVQVK